MRILLLAAALTGIVCVAFLLFGPAFVQPRPTPNDVLAGQGFSKRFLVPEQEVKRVFDSVLAKAKSANESAKCAANAGLIFNIVGAVAGLLAPFVTALSGRSTAGSATAGALAGKAKIVVAALGLVAGIGAAGSGLLVAQTSKLDKDAEALKKLMTSARGEFFAAGTRDDQQAVLKQLEVDLARF